MSKWNAPEAGETELGETELNRRSVAAPVPSKFFVAPPARNKKIGTTGTRVRYRSTYHITYHISYTGMHSTPYCATVKKIRLNNNNNNNIHQQSFFLSLDLDI